MTALWTNKLAYLGLSMSLLVGSLPLISLGATTGPSWTLWLGTIALFVGALIPPAQRILSTLTTRSD